MWFVLSLSVLVSAGTLSMIIFRAHSLRKLPYEQLSSPMRNQVLDTAPLVFLLTLAVGILLAIYEFGKTNSGYKYMRIKVAAYVIACVAVLAIIFSYTGVNHVAHKTMVDNARLAPSVDEIRNKHFNQPKKGSLVGIVNNQLLTNRAGEETILIQGEGITEEDFSTLETLDQPVILFGTLTQRGFIVCDFSSDKRPPLLKRSETKTHGVRQRCEEVN